MPRDLYQGFVTSQPAQHFGIGTITVDDICTYLCFNVYKKLQLQLVFVFCHVLTFVRYIGVYYTFGLLDCVRYK